LSQKGTILLNLLASVTKPLFTPKNTIFTLKVYQHKIQAILDKAVKQLDSKFDQKK